MMMTTKLHILACAEKPEA